MISFKSFLAESRYSSLYHATHLAFLDDILEDGLLSESPGISAARTMGAARWYMGNEHSLYNKKYIVLELNQNAIRQRYKVTPYDWFMQPHRQIPKRRRKEAEEIIGVPFGDYLDPKYIKAIHYFEVDKKEVDELKRDFPKFNWKAMK